MDLKLAATTATFLGFCLSSEPARSQETNGCPLLPQTKLESFETNTSTVIVKATAPIGDVAAETGVLSIRCREITETGTGRRESGLAIGIKQGNWPEEMVLIDYDELDGVLNGLDYLNRVDWSVTSLSGFDAIFTTKGGFRISAFGSRRTGTIEFAARNTRTQRPPVALTRAQVQQLRSLIEQAKAKLDSLRTG